MNLSVISPRNMHSFRSIFELAQGVDELDKETSAMVDHSILPRHLVLFQGFEIPGGVCGSSGCDSSGWVWFSYVVGPVKWVVALY